LAGPPAISAIVSIQLRIVGTVVPPILYQPG